MPYSTNPYAPKVRALAVNLITQEGWSMRQVARHIGVEPSTVSRWAKQAPQSGTLLSIPTRSSRPHGHPTAISEEVKQRMVDIRLAHGRCAKIIHAELQREGIHVSLSTVKRTLKRARLIKPRSPGKKWHLSGTRPVPESAGDLVQMDSIHVSGQDWRRTYIVTVLDCFSRWAFAYATQQLTAGNAIRAYQEAKKHAPFAFSCVQSDHGSEFSRYFTRVLNRSGVKHRQIRVRKPNDNAHVERFNRTIQEELRPMILKYKHNVPKLNQAIQVYLKYYNTERLHLGLGCKTPLEVLRRC